MSGHKIYFYIHTHTQLWFVFSFDTQFAARFWCMHFIQYTYIHKMTAHEFQMCFRICCTLRIIQILFHFVLFCLMSWGLCKCNVHACVYVDHTSFWYILCNQPAWPVCDMCVTCSFFFCYYWCFFFEFRIASRMSKLF